MTISVNQDKQRKRKQIRRELIIKRSNLDKTNGAVTILVRR